MSFQIHCPHCNRVLNVTEKAYGKVLPCPACQQQMTVPWPVESLPQATLIPARPQWSNPVNEATRAPSPTRPLPAGSPPTQPVGVPNGNDDDPLGILDSGPGAVRPLPESRSPMQNGLKAGRGLNFADIFLGNEKEYAFGLAPGEERLAEVTIHHQHLFFIKSGITRVTLTSQRLLCTATRVFSPVYWLLLVLFPPLIFYYVARIWLNHSVAFPLGSLDSLEKRYRPNVFLFVAMLIVNGMLEGLVHFLMGREAIIVEWIVLVVLAQFVLFVLIVTRIPTIEVRSRNNRFVVFYRLGDQGVSEESIDDFFKAVHAQMEVAKTS